MSSETSPGLLILQGNRFELLSETVFEWLAGQPLAPLEEEVFLVQSNGVAEWLKMALAQRAGVCASVRLELPARFLWRSFRQVLGAAEVPANAPLDRTALTWRLMALLPHRLGMDGYEPLSRFLESNDAVKRLQLSRRLADLFDQYQVYRSDWLEDWGAGRDVLRHPLAPVMAVPQDQRWQPLLWRDLVGALGRCAQGAIRPELHRRFIAALEAGQEPAKPVARRVVVFGMSHLPLQTLTALTALSTRSQVLLAAPNPCRYHWADLLSATGAVPLARRRQPISPSRSDAAVAAEDLHLHTHPLLAAWGRQAADFVRQLDAFDDALTSQERLALPKIDLFDDTPGDTLLRQVQAHIRDLVPLAEHPQVEALPSDRSIVFHIAHSAQREVEVLHDQLLALLAEPGPGGALQPRDIVVMLPDVETFAPFIRAVFGQYPRHDARFIPFDIADTRERSTDPFVVVIDWLLRLPSQRCRLTDVRDLLDVPGVAARFGLAAADLPRLSHWMLDAGVRWGLNGSQRAGLGLEACGEQNTWLFGLRRMLLGYASGEAAADEEDTAFEGIEPYSEVGGLDAALAGSLAVLVEQLLDWWRLAAQPATPLRWAEAAQHLLDAFLAPVNDAERFSVTALRDALQCWLQACEAADFDEAVPLPVFREAWLAELDEPGLGRRFLGGGVTFCTLVPMRSIPFEVVCLMGMNDGDFPRSASRSDFDLMALPGQARPGDRSRRDDDRQLMLEALLSARRVLYLSWAGRNARDNSEQPPSVLVSQLRDYLSAGWQGEVLAPRTVEHPLQPFSRRYFAEGSDLFTHAREWRSAHTPPGRDDDAGTIAKPSATEADPAVPLTLARLAAFLRNPVRDFFRHRLDVVFGDFDEVPPDEELFGLSGLESHEVVRELIKGFDPVDALHPGRRLGQGVQRLQRAGRLPMAGLGDRCREALVEAVAPMLQAWGQVHLRHPRELSPQALRIGRHAGAIDDLLTPCRQADAQAAPVWLELVPHKLLVKKALRGDMLLNAWVRSVVAGACGIEMGGVLVGRDAEVVIPPMPAAEALPLLDALLEAFEAGAHAPLPVPSLTALAWVSGGDEAAEKIYEGDAQHLRGESREACLTRMYPDFSSLSADGRFVALAQRLFAPLHAWLHERLQVTRHQPSREDDDD